MRASVVFVALILLSASLESHADDGPAAVVRWNETVLAAAEAEDGFLTLKGLRTASMMHLSMHEAMNRAEATNPRNASMFAAFVVVADQYPDLLERFDALLDETLTGSLSATDERLGRAIAEEYLASRDGDGWDGQPEYQWHPMGPGVYAEFA